MDGEKYLASCLVYQSRFILQVHQVKCAQLIFDGKPFERAEVTIYDQQKWQKEMRTNKNGQIAVELPWASMYLIQAKYEVGPVKGNQHWEAHLFAIGSLGLFK